MGGCISYFCPKQDQKDYFEIEETKVIGKAQLLSSKLNFHVELDPNSEYGIKGFPDECKEQWDGQGIQPSQIRESSLQTIETMNQLDLKATQIQKSKFNSKQQEIENLNKQQEKIIMLSFQDFRQTYPKMEKIGNGAQSEIYVSRISGSTEVVALRILRPKNDLDQKQILEEIYAFRELQHPNIIIMYQPYLVIDQQQDFYAISMEIMQIGSVYQLISYCNNSLSFILDTQSSSVSEDQDYNQNESSQKYDADKKVIKEEVIAYILRETLKGICFMHQHNFIHRDIKSDNILVNQNGQIKICDLGLVAHLIQTQKERETNCGSKLWVAPEILLGKKYDEKVDLWSLGIVALELADGEPPTLELTIEELTEQYESNSAPMLLQPEKWSPQFIEFLQMCLQINPHDRKSALEIMDSQFIANAVIYEQSFHQFIKHLAQNKTEKLLNLIK